MKRTHYLRKLIWGILLAGAAVLFAADAGWELPGFKAQATYERTLSKRYSGNMDPETGEWIDQAGEALNAIAEERSILALVYLSEEYPVRREPSYESEAAVTVLSGHLVNILDVYVDDNHEVWEYVTLYYGEDEYYGFIPRASLAVSDARFLEWEELYGMNPSQASVYSTVSGGDGSVSSGDIEQFPESYKAALYALKEKHPNWLFVKMNTGLDWDDVIYNEMQNSRSLVYYTFPDWAKGSLYDSHNWYHATEPALKKYMDPRNGLTEDAVFQFELLTYNEQNHTEEALSAFLNNTFMNDSRPAPGTSMTYAHIFWAVGKDGDIEVSPFHLAARVYQEQGKGDSPLISGTYPGFEGYYNYFNIKASGTTNEQIYVNGLTYAKNQNPPWDSAYWAILGGAKFISGNYIRQGQNTLYLQKYNVNPNGYYEVYTHQYMQNISAPTTEASSVRKLYAKADALESPFVFQIPVYENMPEEPCGDPKESLTVKMPVPEGYVEPVVYLDGVPYDVVIQNGSYMLEAPDKNAQTAVAYRYNASGIPEGMYVWTLGYGGGKYTVTPEPELEDLLTFHGFSIRITGKSGIRFKTGISRDLRRALTGTGVNGYTLKEYGTLIMNGTNLGIYPMVRGGEKISTGIAYGRDENGVMQDKVFETVDGRYRYTSVLVGLPVSRYKTEFAFRGFATLEKDGKQITLYGPVRAKSIYALAKQLLDMNTYKPGSDAYKFLKQLMADADALDTP